MLHDVVARALKVPAASITDASSPETLRGWDSLTHLDLISEIEDAYAARFSTGEIMRVKSVADLRHLLREKGLEVD